MKPNALDFLGRQPRWLLLMEAYLLSVIVGVLDFLTGYEVSFYLVYSVPILIVVWYLGRNPGLVLSVFCGLVWGAADFVGHSFHFSSAQCWNVAVQLAFFVFMVVCGSALKGQRDESRARAEWLERFHTLAQVSPVGIFRVGLAGELVYVNEHWRRIVGLENGAALPPRWAVAFHPDDRERVDAEWKRAVKERRQCVFEARFQHANGRTIWVLAHVAAEGDGRGGVAGYVGAITDMTELRRLEREVLEISEREQQRIGQDLHDDLCQQLVAIQYSAASVKRDLKARGDGTAARVGEMVDLLKGMLMSTRQMARRIFPVNLDQAGLMAALQELAANSTRFFDINCRLECPEPILVEDNATGAHLYRIAQEALSNAVRHGQAKEVVISLAHEGHQLGLTIRDNGIGLQPAAAEGPGMGLHIMHYRSRMIGATLRVEPLPEGGTRVHCTLPQRGSQLREMANAVEKEISIYES